MINKTDYSIVAKIPTEELEDALSVLDSEESQAIIKLKEELTDNWHKRQIYRTETEMRISVLNDARHPTNASKYWQAVREMGAHFDALMQDTFQLKRKAIQKLRIERELKKADEEADDLREMELLVDLQENQYATAHLKQSAQDRVRELKLWSKIKDELDNGEFDTQDVNTHQANSYKHILANRVRALGPGSSPSEISNAVGPYETVMKLTSEEGKLLGYKEIDASKQLQEENKVQE